MAYKKPQIVAKSAAKQTFVAGCSTKENGGRDSNGKVIGCVGCKQSPLI